MKRTTHGWSAALIAAALTFACKPPKPAEPPEVTTPVTQEPVEEGPVWPDEPFRAQQPAPGPIAQLQLPAIKTFTMDNGIEVFLVSEETLPTVYMTLEFDVGEVDDPANRAGLHSLCTDLIDEGTKRLEKIAFEEAQADHAIELWANSGRETSTFGLRALKGQLEPGLDLFVEMLREPGLRQKDLDRLRDRRKASLAQTRGNPASIPWRVYPTLIWGQTHPYGQVDTEKTLDGIKLADCKKVAGKFKPEGARLFVVGMITEDEIKAALGPRLDKWKGKAPKAKAIPAAKPRGGTIFLVDVPGAAQSVISIGHPGPSRKAPDYEATYLMAQILGGSFSSRINMNLREDKGYAYGGRGGISYYRGGSYFSAGASVRTDATGASVRELAKEIAGMRAGPPTAEEIQREQAGAIAALPATFSTPTRTLFAYKWLDFYGLGLDWYQGYTKRIGEVTPAAVQEAAKQHLQERDFVVLVVGDAATVQADLQAIADEKLFGDGGLALLDADGQPVKAGATKAAAKPIAGKEGGGLKPPVPRPQPPG
ncbi:MAG: insulinase family protein [Myxococcales bacterium]|nr:insulinase family protein [Myxococcales bacterium]MCB9568974.1 insulinase family protein [Myxococcales bacterium]